MIVYVARATAVALVGVELPPELVGKVEYDNALSNPPERAVV